MPTIPTVSPLNSIQTRVTLTTLLIFLLSLWSLSYYASQMLRKDMERLLGEQQRSEVFYLAAELNHGLEERRDALKTVARSVSSAMLGDQAALLALLNERPLLRGLFNGGLLAYRWDGSAMAALALAGGPVADRVGDLAPLLPALLQDGIAMGRPVLDPNSHAAVFGMLVPIRDAKGQAIGALGGLTDAGKTSFLDQITQGRYGRTGDYFLVAPQHRLIVTASDPSRSMDVFPAPGSNPSVDRFMRGFEGPALYVNSRGVEVLGSAKGIPVAGWFVGVTLPTAEAFAPIHAMQRRTLQATMVLTLLAGFLTWWILRRQLAPMLSAAHTLATMSDANLPPQPLCVARYDEIGQLIGVFNHLLGVLAQREVTLLQNKALHSAILQTAMNGFWLVDPQGRLLEVNETYCRMSGYSAQELLGKNVSDLESRETASRTAGHIQQVREQGEGRFNSRHCRKDGSLFDVEVSVQHRPDEQGRFVVFVQDITDRRQVEEDRRIAAIAFECQEGIVVTNADAVILRVNQTFTRITGYSQSEVQGVSTAILGSDRHSAAFFEGFWRETRHAGVWQGEMWQRRKDGTHYPARVTMTAVRDDTGRVTHYVGNFTDATHSQMAEQQRLCDEAALRDTLVREVHHRIKNNLQGITGILGQFAKRHPEIADPINQAMGQVRGISVIHGLQGRAASSSVRLCELTGAIAEEIQSLWRTPVALDIPAAWVPCLMAEKEAVPIALVLNELILNAVKHGGKAQGQVNITLRKGAQPDVVQITIVNTGTLAPEQPPAITHHMGLQLVAALMPRHGARIAREQRGEWVTTVLELEPPVISLEMKEAK